MFSYDDMWKAIDRLADSHGYSPSGLAKKAGLDPTTFNKSKRMSSDGKPRWPSTESLSKILAVTGATMSDFIALIGENENNAAARDTIPLINSAIAGKNGHFTAEGHPAGNGWDDFSFPGTASRRDEHLFAIEVIGQTLMPAYREGDVLVASPQANVRRGDRVIVRTRGGDFMIHELRRQTASRIELRAIGHNGDNLSLPAEDISWMARIIWVSQ
ncbi:MAG: helix-turn-helix transcriptional regulator [Micavibrio aeruginosavorus]|uniref:Helix-turn-helix transcriptional regulator n=1 Tax=Micavibrio aeruginosavorus TaxID=349221 RepID=A0A7T5R1Z9_9BACT|nr:MAG: helix-turn-helix transcriptional regulator [Micavibrio aeruginosavorus]